MALSFLDKVMIFVLLGFMAGGLYAGFQESGIGIKEIKNQTIESPKNTSVSLFLFAEGLNLNVPAYRNEWLPFTDREDAKYVFMIEDIPLPGWEDLIPIAIAILIVLMITHLFHGTFSYEDNGFMGILYTIILYVIFILGAWILWHILWYQAMILGGEGLGMSKDAVIEARNSVLDSTESALLPLAIISLLSIISFLKIFGNKMFGSNE